MSSNSNSNQQQQQHPPAAAVKDWRKSVLQSYRNEEVTNIAKVLAALEPNTSSASKLGLAMRFEDAIFQAATSLQDYRKKLAKRLKKVQKSYKPPQEGSAAVNANAVNKGPKVSYEVKEKQLRDRFGERLKYIVFHADDAVAILKMKDPQRAAKVKIHTDQAEQWAVDIGVLSTDEIKLKLQKKRGANSHAKVRQPESLRRRPGFLEKLKEHLEQRVDNTRSHVVQVIHQDKFLEENLVKVEDMYLDASQSVQASLASRNRIVQTLQRLIREENSTSTYTPNYAVDIMQVQQQYQELQGMSIPFPRKGDTDDDIKKIALLQLERIKLCTQLMVSYVMLTKEGKGSVPGLLKQSYSMGIDGIKYLLKYYEDDNEDDIVLEDSWKQLFVYIPPEHEGRDRESPTKKRKRSFDGDVAFYITKTRVLFTPGHKTPSNIIHELESKKAKVFRPNGNDAGARIMIKFGQAFEMKIFFSPLLVTVRAMNPKRNAKSTKNEKFDDEGKSDFCRTVMDCGLPTWQKSSDGLAESLGFTGEEAVVNAAYIDMVSKKLDFASAQATSILRKCFTDLAGQTYANAKSDFEIALAEGTALLHFLRLARENYRKESS